MSLNPAELESIDKHTENVLRSTRKECEKHQLRIGPEDGKGDSVLRMLTRFTLAACMEMINEEVPKIQRDIDSRNTEQS